MDVARDLDAGYRTLDSSRLDWAEMNRRLADGERCMRDRRCRDDMFTVLADVMNMPRQQVKHQWLQQLDYWGLLGTPLGNSA